MTVSDIMTTNVISVLPHTTLEEAAQIMVDNKISGLVVTNANKHIVGILSEGDLLKQQKSLPKPLYLMFLDSAIQVNLREFNQNVADILATEVMQLMTKDVITVTPETSVREAADLIVNKKINRLPVVDENDQIMGIVTRQDIIRYTYNVK